MQSAIEQIEIDGQKIHVAGRLPEPAAVAIDYLHYIQHIVPEEQRIKADQFTVLVNDLGYGTFDTAVVTASSKDQPYVLHAKDGLPEVGGKNFDEVISGYRTLTGKAAL
jgi:molecular chaperone DnaK (HSP70)